LAKGLQQNLTLESLVLRHNHIGEEGEAGLAALCRSLHGNRTLRHLDLRYNGLSGALAAASLAELLRSNTTITHMELSWNPFEPAGGQLLLDGLQMNSTLFDCQLTGCRLAQDTLLDMARLLHRNRRAGGGKLQAGPYVCSVQAEAATSSGFTDEGDRGGNGTQQELPRGELTNLIVSGERTREFMDRLSARRLAPGRLGPQDSVRIQEFVELLESNQKELDCQREATEEVREHTRLVMEGFQSRELRYRGDIAAAQDRLLECKKEKQELQAILNRMSDTLSLEREICDQAKLDLKVARGRAEAEEARSKNDLATVTYEQKELQEHLGHLQEKSRRQDEELGRLRSKTGRLREGVAMGAA
jgi:hypothetical protein